jgi:DNA-binding transcriptional MocR family regulator
VLLPLYQRLAAHYSAAIELGSLKPGERMPSVRELMARHDISLSTALQVLRFLEAQGCLEARPAWLLCARRGRVIFL